MRYNKSWDSTSQDDSANKENLEKIIQEAQYIISTAKDLIKTAGTRRADERGYFHMRKAAQDIFSIIDRAEDLWLEMTSSGKKGFIAKLRNPQDGTGPHGAKNRKATEECPLGKEKFVSELRDIETIEHGDINEYGDTNEGCWQVASASEGSDKIDELYNILHKEDHENLLSTKEDYEKALKYLLQWETDDQEQEHEPFFDVIEYLDGYEEIDGYIIGETPYGDVLVYAKGEYTIDN